MSLNRDLWDVSVMITLEVCVFRRKTTEVGHRSPYIVPKGSAINVPFKNQNESNNAGCRAPRMHLRLHLQEMSGLYQEEAG